MSGLESKSLSVRVGEGLFRFESKDMEVEYFGPQLGEVALYQMSMLDFHQACLSKNTNRSNQLEANDSTGKRLYAGAHLAIRFLTHYRKLFENKSVVELGCGIGALGLMLAKLVHLSHLVLTDGNIETLSTTQQNINHFYDNQWIVPLENDSSSISPSLSSSFAPDCSERLVMCTALPWGQEEDIQRLFHKIHTSIDNHIDVVIGCELMYYLTDIPALMLTVTKLLQHDHETVKRDVLFFHVHLFRKLGQEQELIDHLRDCYDWISCEVPLTVFVTPTEINEHVEWNRMRALISGPREVVSRLQSAHSEWLTFTAVRLEDVDEEQCFLNCMWLQQDDDNH